VVLTLTIENVGNCTVVPSVVVVVAFARPVVASVGPVEACSTSCCSTPVNVNVLTRADAAEERHQRSSGRTVRSSDTTACTVSIVLREDHDDRLLGRGEVADDRNHADDERALRNVLHVSPAGR